MPPGPAWEQDDVEVTVSFSVPAATATRDVACKITSTTLSLTVSGESLFEDTFPAKVDVDESFWALEGSGDQRRAVITLTKLKTGREWPFLGKEMQRAQTAESGASGGGGGEGEAASGGGGGGGSASDLLSLGNFMDDEDAEDAELQQAQEVELEGAFNTLREEKGLDDEATLNAFFEFFNIGIQLYHLNKLSGYLKDVVPVCRARGDSFKLKAIQALAFVLWKQQSLQEAVTLFHEMEELMGKNAALCENIAHTYNSLGNYEKAEDYFRQALAFIESGCTSGGSGGGNRGGVLLGLGLVRDRLERPAEALPILEQAYEFYKQRAGGELASLQGKAAVSTGMVHLKLGDVKKAEQYIREAIHTYEVTCGETSPLTGGAYYKLGQILWQQRRRKPARKALKRAYELEAIKDAFTIVGVLEIHNVVMDTFLKDAPNGTIDRVGFGAFLEVVATAEKRILAECVQDGNAACYYKAAAELRTWGGAYAEAVPTFNLAVKLFNEETTRDCSNFIAECNSLLAFAQRNLDGTQESPMVLQTDAASSGGGEPEGEPAPADPPAVADADPGSGAEGAASDGEAGTESREAGSPVGRASESAYFSVDEPDDMPPQ